MYVGDSVNDQIITFKKLEEPIVEEHDIVKEPIKGNDEEERKSISYLRRWCCHFSRK